MGDRMQYRKLRTKQAADFDNRITGQNNLLFQLVTSAFE